MSKLIKQMLNFVGWETEAEEEAEEQREEAGERFDQSQLYQPGTLSRKSQSKVVNIHAASQMKVVVMQPDKFEDAQDICDHLKGKKPIVMNLESVEKDIAQRIVDFLSGSVYALDGNIQKVSASIFVITPNNVDIMGDFKDELKSKGAFQWLK